MASPIGPNRQSGTYPGQRPARGQSFSAATRPQTVQPTLRDVTLMDVNRLGAGINNLITDLTGLFSNPVDVPGTRSDVINEFDVRDIGEVTIRDAVRLLFDDITNGKRLQFRATISNITEAHSPEWVQHQYIGRPYPIHQYKGVSRTLAFDFKVYAMNKRELQFIWRKLNYLTGMTHPGSYASTDEGAGFMTPPYIALTLGNIFNSMPGFINSLNYTIPDGISWDVNEELPLGIDVNVGYTIIERRAGSNATRSNFYSADNGILGDDLPIDRGGIGGAWDDLKDAFG